MALLAKDRAKGVDHDDSRMHLLWLHRRARLSWGLRLGKPRSAGLYGMCPEKPAAQAQEGQAMTGKAIAGTRHAWATVYCRSCKRIVHYQADMVTTSQIKRDLVVRRSAIDRDVVECACGELIEIGGR